MASNKHTIVALVADRPGVLNRMASLFRRRRCLFPGHFPQFISRLHKLFHAKPDPLNKQPLGLNQLHKLLLHRP